MLRQPESIVKVFVTPVIELVNWHHLTARV